MSDNMNSRLQTTTFQRQKVALAGCQVRFDEEGNCEGIVRGNKEPHPYPEPLPITEEILEDVRCIGGGFLIDGEKVTPKAPPDPFPAVVPTPKPEEGEGAETDGENDGRSSAETRGETEATAPSEQPPLAPDAPVAQPELAPAPEVVLHPEVASAFTDEAQPQEVADTKAVVDAPTRARKSARGAAKA
jgi:hypothetical protein